MVAFCDGCASTSETGGELNVDFETKLQRLQEQNARLSKMNDELIKQNGNLSSELVSLGKRPQDVITASRNEVESDRSRQVSGDTAGLRDRVLSSDTAGESLAPYSHVPSLRPSARTVQNDALDDFVKEREQSQSSFKNVTSEPSSQNWLVLQGSALSKSRPVQALIYLAALAGVVFVLVAGHFDADDAHGDDGHHRRLGGDVSPILVHIAFCVFAVGIVSIAINLLKQPLILGYLLGGVLVGPIGLKIVPGHEDISTLSSLGLVFLLFMVGLELDVMELLKMGKVVLLTGLFQFPVCAGIHIGVFSGLHAAGLSFGEGDLAPMYVGMVTGISSTMIVVKLLSAKCDMDSQPGRLTIGILIFQDIWAIIILAVQPKLDSPEVTGILVIFGKIAILLAASLWYAKFVMPAVLFSASKNVELMLVLSLAWCFFVCCAAVLSFVGLGMELASLIAGLALATFPYSAEFNGKIKYIRDFFITLFFVGLGMQIPVPTIEAIMKGVLVAVVVLLVRWIGIFLVSRLLGAQAPLSTVATINLSQISEFGLVICSLGMNYDHIKQDTLTIIIWTFAMLAISSSYLINGNRTIANFLMRGGRRCMGRSPDKAPEVHDSHDSHEERDIIFLGFHNIAAMVFAHLAHHKVDLLKRVKVVDFNEDVMKSLKDKGVPCAYGDITSADVLEHCHHGEVRMVVCTIPDSMLQGADNLSLLKVSKQVWGDSKVIVTAESSQKAGVLYNAGADYVLRYEKLCGDRLGELIGNHFSQVFNSGHSDLLSDSFAKFKRKDQRTKSATFNDAAM
jgi:Kef-type K+ transport system membrane component KefB